MSTFVTLKDGKDSENTVEKMEPGGSWGANLYADSFYLAAVVPSPTEEDTYILQYAPESCKEVLDNEIEDYRDDRYKDNMTFFFLTRMPVDYVEAVCRQVEARIGIAYADRTRIYPVAHIPNGYIVHGCGYWSQAITLSSAFTWIIRCCVKLLNKVQTFDDFDEFKTRELNGHEIDEWLPKVKKLIELKSDLNIKALWELDAGACDTELTEIVRKGARPKHHW